MADFNLMQLLPMLAAAIAVGALAYALGYPYFSGDMQADKRVASVKESRARRNSRRQNVEQSQNRRKAVADTLKEIESRQRSKEKVSLRLRLERAGLDITPNTFWVASAVTGVVSAIVLFIMMPGVPTVGLAAAVFIGAFGLPRWFVSHLTKSRQKKFLNEFSNAIDVIVRGVKSGLPLNECLNIIARESPQPIRGEFQEIVDQQRVGVPLSECFDRMMQRMPMSEVKFFAIVIAIQQQAGGNLSEALGNLSQVLRDRKMMAAKVQALSAEAKASAMVLASMPFGVMGMVYMSAPHYISLLWSKKMGQFMCVVALIWMAAGIFSMKKMINFKF
jgi:tight adherence protein B